MSIINLGINEEQSPVIAFAHIKPTECGRSMRRASNFKNFFWGEGIENLVSFFVDETEEDLNCLVWPRKGEFCCHLGLKREHYFFAHRLSSAEARGQR